jgi:DNA-binding response OmpR family regulator
MDQETAPLLLLIEDEESILEHEQWFFTNHGFRVLVASNGAEGIRLAVRHQPDVVLSDISLPDIDGFEVLDAIKEKKVPTRFIAFTGYAKSLKQTVRLVKSGACDVIHKPSHLNEVLITVNRALLLEKTINLREPTPLQADLWDAAHDLDVKNARLMKKIGRLKTEIANRRGRTTVFIGHGRSSLWRELKDFLSEKLKLEWDEFNRESTAGLSTTERLNDVMRRAAFAFLVMTAEDEHADGTKHARENVIHEVGLFQGLLGFAQAIVLLEEGCAEFSNLHGLTQIRFPAGVIKAAFAEVRDVLEREGILSE